MGTDENTESRIETAIERLQTIAETIVANRSQGSLNMLDGETEDGLAVENAALKRELADLRAKYDALKQTADAVSGRLDNSIDELSAILEQ
jgi:predicted  nucleic acid-binding Zn-ribbon protein